jgi:acyl dehydratase
MADALERPTVSDGGISERRFGPITRTDIVRYAGAGGDFNPMHHDDEFAQSAGYPSVFAMGLLTAGLLSGYASDALGLENIHRYSVRYTGQVYPGDTLVMTGEAVPDDDTTEPGEVAFSLTVRRDPGDGTGAGDVVLTGRVVARVAGTTAGVA